MNDRGSKKILFNKSSLLSLKAELLKKQEEVNEKKHLPQHKVDNYKPPVAKSANKNGKESSKQEKRSFKDNLKAVDTEELEACRKSKLALEKKAELYAHLSDGAGNSELSGRFLVDFNTKKQQDPEPASPPPDPEVYQSNDEDDSEWTEFTDCLGRTRKCLKSDLDLYVKRDQELMRATRGQETPTEVAPVTETPQVEKPLLVQTTNDYLQSLREKWEQKERELLTKDKDIHYQDLLYDEARMHGVSYFSFSTDEAERQKQMAALQQQRRETLAAQEEAEQRRRRRDDLMAARVAAARARQRARAGLPPDQPDQGVCTQQKQMAARQQQRRETLAAQEEAEQRRRRRDDLMAARVAAARARQRARAGLPPDQPDQGVCTQQKQMAARQQQRRETLAAQEEAEQRRRRRDDLMAARVAAARARQRARAGLPPDQPDQGVCTQQKQMAARQQQRRETLAAQEEAEQRRRRRDDLMAARVAAARARQRARAGLPPDQPDQGVCTQQKQMAARQQQRRETLAAQEEAEQRRRRRDDLMAARVAAARARQRARAGLPPDQPDQEKEKDFTACLLEFLTQQKDEADAKAKEQEKKLKEEQEKERQKLREAYVRDWDIGKEGVEGKVKKFREMTQEEYVEQQRAKRIDEFAPIQGLNRQQSTYAFDDTGKKVSTDDSPPQPPSWADVRSKARSPSPLNISDMEPEPQQKGLYFSSKKQPNYYLDNKGTTISTDDSQNVPKSRLKADTSPPPIISDIEPEQSGLNFLANKSVSKPNLKYKNFVKAQELTPIDNEVSDDELEEDIRTEKRRTESDHAEIAPPPTYDYYGPVPKKVKSQKPFVSDINEAFAQGTKSLERKGDGKRLPQHYDFTFD